MYTKMQSLSTSQSVRSISLNRVQKTLSTCVMTLTESDVSFVIFDSWKGATDMNAVQVIVRDIDEPMFLPGSKVLPN